jgi:Gram-negative porin
MEIGMRKYLLASTALLAASVGLAQAQAQPLAPAAQSQGQLAAPYGSGPASNNNNNAWGIANTPSGSKDAGSLSTIYAPNTIAAPAPGTVVIRLNGRVEADFSANFSSVDRSVSATGAPTGFKLNPVGVSSYMRLYPGFDGMAANGVRYGAAIELRENFQSGIANNFGTNGTTATSPSANSSLETVFVRRAFTYLASDQAGIVRFGQADGVLGLFDNCIFTSQCWDAGITDVNGGVAQSTGPAGAFGVPFVWLSQSGAEYANNKIVYLTPQFYGFDFGVQYAPTMGNTNQNAGIGAGCNQAGPTCISVSSGNDPTRWLNQVGAGLRFQHTFGPVDVKAYGFYETAGKEQLTTSPVSTLAQARAGTVINGVASGAGTLRYDNLNFYKAGVAVTAANITLSADYIGGAVNGALVMRPSGGAPTNAVLTGVTSTIGPFILGAQIGLIDTQGDARLTGISQRHEYEVAFGGTYKVAPGLQLVAEYLYTHRHQGGFDFATNALGTPGGPATAGTSTRDAQGQGFSLSTVLTW